jgi:TonB family protein
MRVSSDFFVVGMTGLGTALFLTQLLIISRQIASANNHIQAELAAERAPVPVNWIDVIKRRPLIEPWFSPPPSPLHLRVDYPQLALERHVGGFVDFDLIINPDGSIASSKVAAEVPRGYGFAAAAAKGLSKWRFEPDRPPKSKPTVRRFRVNFKPDS